MTKGYGFQIIQIFAVKTFPPCTMGPDFRLLSFFRKNGIKGHSLIIFRYRRWKDINTIPFLRRKRSTACHQKKGQEKDKKKAPRALYMIFIHEHANTFVQYILNQNNIFHAFIGSKNKHFNMKRIANSMP